MARQLGREEALALRKEIVDHYNASDAAKWKKTDRWQDICQAYLACNGLETLENNGGESEGEYAETVIRFKDKIYSFHYNYYSHDGFNYDYIAVSEVQPVQRLVTFYE